MNASTILLPLALIVAACQPLPKMQGIAVEVMPVEGRLATINPNDVVVAPIEMAVEGMNVPEEALRQAVVGSLIARRYAPLSLEFVDASIPEPLAGGVMAASYRGGSLGEDAVLRTIVHGWDTSLWTLRKAITVDLELIMESTGTGGEELWHARLKQRFDFEQEARLAGTESALMATAIRIMTDEVCSKLPERSVEPGAH